MKRLCRDSPIFSHTVFGKEGSSSVISEVEEMMISVRTREKFSFLCSYQCNDFSNSYHSPSSESSDGDCEEVLSMKQLKSNDLNQFIEIESAYVIEEAATPEDQRTEIVLGANDSSPRNLREASCNLDLTMRVPILEGHIWILGCNQAPLSKDLVVEVDMLRAIYVILIGSAYPQSTTNGCKKEEECCFNEACVIFITLTTHLQLYMKQHRMSRLSLQENGKVELESAEGRKLAE